MLDLKTVVKWLQDNEYMDATCIPTEKFNKETKELPLVLTGQSLLPVKSVDWMQLFIRFIAEAEVPKFLEGSRGDLYPGNKFNEKAMSVFRKAVENGVRLDVLTGSTKLYYKSKVKLKQAIGNYFITGSWRSDYESLLSAAQEGKLTEHLKNETDAGQSTAWKLG